MNNQDNSEDNGTDLPPPAGYVRLAASPQERLRLIEQNVRDYSIFVTDAQGYIASWNVGAERILGYTESEVIGMDCGVFFTPEDRAHRALEQERSTAIVEGHATSERWHVRKDGTRFWGSGTLTALRDPEKRLCGFVQMLHDITAQRQAEIQRLDDQVRLAERERQSAILQERNRLAREIHDTLAQGFTGITIQLEAAEDALPHDPAQTNRHIDRAIQLARESLAEARRSVRALRPQRLDDKDLPTALALFVRQITEGISLHATFDVEGGPVALPMDIENDLLRIGQEALTNALKHAQANEIHVKLTFAPDQIRLSVQDDGRGFDPALVVNRSGFGLLGMRERVERMGGDIEFWSEVGQGTRVIAAIPITSVMTARTQQDDASSEGIPSNYENCPCDPCADF